MNRLFYNQYYSSFRSFCCFQLTVFFLYISGIIVTRTVLSVQSVFRVRIEDDLEKDNRTKKSEMLNCIIWHFLTKLLNIPGRKVLFVFMALKDQTEKRFKREMKFNLRGLTLKGERRKPKWGPRFLVQHHTG